MEADGEQVPETNEKSEKVEDLGEKIPQVDQDPASQEDILGMGAKNPMVSFKDLLNICKS